nr:hypothetical protein [Microbacterium humi]
MRDVEGRDAEVGLQPLQPRASLLAQLRVEVRQRLVEQQHGRRVDEGAGKRDALLLTARELVRVPVAERSESHLVERIGDACLLVGLVRAADVERERQVLLRRHVRPERVGLEDHAEVAFLGGHVDALLPVDECAVADRDAPVGGVFEAGDAVQRRRLPAAARTEEREELSLPDGEVDVFEHRHVGELLVEVRDVNFRHLGVPS